MSADVAAPALPPSPAAARPRVSFAESASAPAPVAAARRAHAGPDTATGMTSTAMPTAAASRREDFAGTYGSAHAGKDVASGLTSTARPTAAASRREDFAAAYGDEHVGKDVASGLTSTAMPTAAASRREDFAGTYGEEHAGRDTASGIGPGMRASKEAARPEDFAAYGDEHAGRDTASALTSGMVVSEALSQREAFASTYSMKYADRDTASTQMDLVLGGNGIPKTRCGVREPEPTHAGAWWPTKAPSAGPGTGAATAKPNHRSVDLKAMHAAVRANNEVAKGYKGQQNVSHVFSHGNLAIRAHRRRTVSHPALRRQVQLGARPTQRAVAELHCDDGEAKFLQSRKRIDPTTGTEYSEWDYLKGGPRGDTAQASGAGSGGEDSPVPAHLLRRMCPTHVASLDERNRFRSGWKSRRPLSSMTLWDDEQLAHLESRRERTNRCEDARRQRLKEINTEYNGYNVVTGEEYRAGLSPKSGRRRIDPEEMMIACDVRLARKPWERVSYALGGSRDGTKGAWAAPEGAARPMSTTYGSGAGVGTGGVRSAGGRLADSRRAPAAHADFSSFPRVRATTTSSAAAVRLSALSRGSSSGQRLVPNPPRHRQANMAALRK